MKQWPTFDDDEDAAIATTSGKVKASNHTVFIPNRSSKKRKLNKELWLKIAVVIGKNESVSLKI